MNFLPGCLGIIVFILICCACSEKFSNIKPKIIFTGLLIQISFAVGILKFNIVSTLFMQLGRVVSVIKNSTLEGTSFVFGYIGGGDNPFDIKDGGNTFSLAFQGLPMILVVSSLSMLLFYWKILPIIVNIFSLFLRKTMGVGGALGVCASANMFLGQTDAPLLIKPYLSKLSRSELMAVMTVGMATTSGTVMALYAAILHSSIPGIVTHLIISSLISIPAAITLSHIIVPETAEPTFGKISSTHNYRSSIDAITSGAIEGGKIFLNLIAILIVFVAFITLLNKFIFYLFPDVFGLPLSLERILGAMLSPFTWLMGIPWHEAQIAGNLLGKKIILNEVYAFSELANTSENLLSLNSRLIMVYALCGFANLSSIGFQIGGIGTIVPERRNEIISLGYKAVLAGTLSNMLSATIIGILISY